MEDLAKESGSPVVYPSAGAKRPRTTVSEGVSYDSNRWEVVATEKFPGFHCCRVHKKTSGEVDGERVNSYMERGYTVLYDADSKSPFGARLTGFEHSRLVGNTNYVLMGIPEDVYAARLWDEHEERNSPRPLPKLNPQYSQGVEGGATMEQPEEHTISDEDGR